MNTLQKISNFFVGHYREIIYKLKLEKIFIPEHIRKQIKFRLIFMNPLCYSNGACLQCGCVVPALQMAFNSCEGNCYPPLVSKKKWDRFMNNRAIVYKGNVWTLRKKRSLGPKDLCFQHLTLYYNTKILKIKILKDEKYRELV